MTELTTELAVAQTTALISSYAFDTGKYTTEQLINTWLPLYHPRWIRLATIEALYLGRYKSVSIEQILGVWLRRGNPNPHFTHEFERLICRKLPRHLMTSSNVAANFSPEERVSPPEIKESVANFQSSPEPLETPLPKKSVVPKSLPPLTTNKPISELENLPLVSTLKAPYQADWSKFKQENTPILQFIPLPDVSSFFNKLKAFAELSWEK